MNNKKNGFVLDCSLTMTWCFPDEATSYTQAVRDMFTYTEAVVPSLWPYEVANILWSAERQKRITQAQVIRFKTLLEQCPIAIDHTSTDKAMIDTLELAREQNLTAYDAAYLELATRSNLPIATLDKALQKAAQQIGVELLKVK